MENYKEEIENIFIYWRNKPTPLKEIIESGTWYHSIATALSNIKRFGGMDDQTINVAHHCLICHDIAWMLYEDEMLCYEALHHEIEEAVGVGDICVFLKKFIFKNNKKRYNALKMYLRIKIGLTEEEDPRLKEIDNLAGLLEVIKYGYDVTGGNYEDEVLINKFVKHSRDLNMVWNRYESLRGQHHRNKIRQMFISTHLGLYDRLRLNLSLNQEDGL